MKVLVTGGEGFIGSNLAIELEKEGHEVMVADHRFISEPSKEPGKRIQWDVTESIPSFPKLDCIFHQAALTDPRYSNDAEILEKNCVGFTNILELAKRSQARVVYASTAGLYGNGPVPMQEDQKKEILTSYAESKLRMDEKAQRLFSEMPIVGLRYFNVYGPREQHKGRPASMIFHLKKQMETGHRPRLFNHGEHQRDFIYVKDVVLANLCALTAPSGIYNVGTGVGTSFNELVRILNKILGKNLEPEYFDMPFDPKTYQNNTVADTTLAREKLGFSAKWDLESGIRDYFASSFIY